MKRFVEGVDRSQSTLFPDRLEDWIGDDNPVRVIDVFVDELDLGELGFERIEPLATGRPSYHPSVLLKLYIYGYLTLAHDKIHVADCADCETRDGRIDRIERRLALDGELDEAQRTRLLEIADKCPVHKTLKGEVEILTELA
jgi:hypothetical protein